MEGSSKPAIGWRHGALLAIPVLALIGGLALDPLPQPLAYHDFADGRALWGIPNFGDVATNLAFLASGLLGLSLCLKRRPPDALLSWSVFFLGVTLVSAGSAYYHWNPGNGTLVWDRLPMTVGFMGAYVALLAEHVSMRLQRDLLLSATLAGFTAVGVWAMSDDLRAYFAVQAIALGSILLILVLFPHRDGRMRYLVAAVACYALAILCEQLDKPIFVLTAGTVSGHSAKHLFAAAAPFWLYWMLRERAAAATPS